MKFRYFPTTVSRQKCRVDFCYNRLDIIGYIPEAEMARQIRIDLRTAQHDASCRIAGVGIEFKPWNRK